MDGHEDGCERCKTQLEPDVSVMKMCKDQDYVRAISCAVLRNR